MKVNLSFLKLVIRLIILLILFVVLFLISAFLYSARYWPDIYNYVNANITITRIPTLSELNLTIIEVEYATEMYSTTDFDYSDSTNGFDTTEDGFSFDEFDFPKAKIRRSAKLEDMGGGNGAVKGTVVVDYFFDDERSTKVIKDLVDESKLTTKGWKDVEVLSDDPVGIRSMNLGQKHKSTLESSLFPWVAAIFVKNESKGSQFDYFCDGAILTETAILTAARCVQNRNETYNEEDFIVILGKTSLQVSGNHEKILRVKSVKLHDNFTITNGIATNDLAVIILEEPVSFDEGIAPAHLVEEDQPKETEEESTKALTTAWSFGGDLTVIYLDKGTANACGTDAKVENTLCATYGLDVPLCPSYGGLYVKKQANKLYLNGIRTGNPLERGICFSKAVSYTSLQSYFKWIREIVENKLA